MDKLFSQQSDPHSTLATTGGAANAAPKLGGAASAQRLQHALWIDGVGSLQLQLRSEVVVGQASPDSHCDVQVVGDLPRQAFSIRRMETDYLVHPFQPIQIDGEPVDRPTPLRDQTHFTVAGRIGFRFTRPNPLSATARLELDTIHRFRPHVDGVLLMGDTCLLGPGPQCHVVCKGWQHQVLLFRNESGLFLRFNDPVTVDGTLVRGVVPVKGKTRVEGDDFSFTCQ